MRERTRRTFDINCRANDVQLRPMRRLRCAVTASNATKCCMSDRPSNIRHDTALHVSPTARRRRRRENKPINKPFISADATGDATVWGQF